MGVLVRVLKSNVNVRREMPRRLGGGRVEWKYLHCI